MGQYTLRTNKNLQLYKRITEDAAPLVKVDGVLSPAGQLVVERGMFGLFDSKVVVALETPVPTLRVVGGLKKPTKLVLVEDVGIQTGELIEFYRSYLGSKGEKSKEALSACWAKVARDIGEYFVLNSESKRIFMASSAGIIFTAKTPMRLQFPA